VAAGATRLSIGPEQMADTPAKTSDNKTSDKTQRPQLSSVFDDMLVQSKERFDDLYRGGFARTGSSKEAKPFAGRAASPGRAAAGFTSAKISPDSAPARWLNEHFGADWRYEVATERREGDEAIVVGKLTFGRDKAIRTQFGRARIGGEALAATSGGVRFKLGSAGSAQDEGEAFRRAAEAALSNCVDLI
jgi:hypothetical protein